MNDSSATPFAAENPVTHRSTRCHRFLSLFTLLFIGAGTSYSTVAEEAVRAAVLDEITVTATRRETGVQSVPASIIATTAADLEKRNITEFKNLTQAVPGLEMTNPDSMINTAVYLRGVGTPGDSAADPSVGIIVDGIYQAQQGAAFTDMMDIDRVEVLKGPQGTLFGKNTTAGVIRVITADPEMDTLSANVRGITGNLNKRELRATANLPIVEEKLAVRLTGYTSERDGHTKNVLTGVDTRNMDSEGYRAKLRWQAADTLDITLSAEKTEKERDMDQALVVYGTKYDAFLDQLPPISLGHAQQDDETVWQENEVYGLHVDWDLPGHTLSTITSYQEPRSALYRDFDNTALDVELGPMELVGLTSVVDYELFTQEIQLASDETADFSYILGAYYQREAFVSTTTLYYPSLDALERPPSDRENTSIAYFGHMNYQLTDKLRASLGLRWTEDEVEGTNFHVDDQFTFDEWTYSAKLAYQLDAAKMIYFSYDKGYKVGGISSRLSTCTPSGAGCVPEHLATWKPETTFAYEAGLKSEWFDRRLRLNAALFFQTYDDYQVRQSFMAAGTVLTTNAAEVEAKGAEAQIEALLSEHWTVSGSLAYTDTTFKKYENAPCPPASIATATPCPTGTQDLSGENLDHAPEVSYNLAAEYRNALWGTGNLDWFSRFDLVYTGDQNLHNLQPKEADIDGYHLANASLGVESAGSWKVTAWAKNITDEEYLVWSELDRNGLKRIEGLPRTYGVTVDWFF